MTDGALAVSELFYSIQGESTRAGLPCVFVRLAGCNLRCRYCDSAYSWEGGRHLSVAEIDSWLDRYPGIMAEVTGGEPLLQDGVYGLLGRLVSSGRTVLLETNGTLPIRAVPAAVRIILDIKCPGSGMDHLTDWDNIGLLRARKEGGSRDEVKFVLSSAEDFSWAGEVIARHRLTEIAPVLLSPVTDRLSPARLAELILKEKMPVRLQLQLHRIIWPHLQRGV